MNELPKIIATDTDIAGWKAWGKMPEQNKEMLEKAECIEDIIAMIEHDDLRAFTYYVISQCHPDFWIIPSSSTGKYHPDWENGNGGLIRHIRAVTTYAISGLRRYGYGCDYTGMDPNDSAEARDIIVCAALLHDWGKNGNPPEKWGRHTTKTHGEDTANYIKEKMFPKFIKMFKEVKDVDGLKKMLKEVCIAIYHHYGIWSKEKLSPSSNKLTNFAKILQEADYYSSREYSKGIEEIKGMKVLAEHGPGVMKRIKKS